MPTKKAAHTPGPWRLSENRYVWSPNKNCIATVHMMADGKRNSELEVESLANAKFIVRACNSHEALLEAAKRAREELADHLGKGNVAVDRAWQELDAAIAKGESR